MEPLGNLKDLKVLGRGSRHPDDDRLVYERTACRRYKQS
jgi:hypothetical protein